MAPGSDMRRSRSEVQSVLPLIVCPLIHGVLLGDTPSQRSPRSFHLAVFTHPGLTKRCQQDDPPTWGYPVRHPNSVAFQVEPQLPQLAVELLRVRLTEERSFLRQ